ncbi:hypothetical protein DSUL_170030 [Desulfovibrionales bacterium]
MPSCCVINTVREYVDYKRVTNLAFNCLTVFNYIVTLCTPPVSILNQPPRLFQKINNYEIMSKKSAAR